MPVNPTPPANAAADTTDAVVVGAGPVGLWQVFQLGLQGLRAHVIDTLPSPGGQCAQLYGDKPIYDIPGLPVCTGSELGQRLMQQAQAFSPQFHWGQRVATLSATDDGGYDIGTEHGLRLRTRLVFLACGVGAFVPRTLKLAGIEPLVGQDVFHHPCAAPPLAQGPVLVLGADAQAIEFALQCPHPVTLSHRRAVFDAPAPLLERLETAQAAGHVRLCIGLPSALHTAQGRLQAVDIAQADGSMQRVEASQLHAFLGVSPKLGPLAQWGLGLNHKLVSADPITLATNLPGVYAVGDLCTYPGKKKLIVCGFHEATMAAFAAVQYLYPDEQRPLQYTTSSSHLHALLGVTGKGA
ncbi:MAG: NAD(P)/FAD-dependent oxidoreductase [Rhodoferax sp.]